MKKILIIENDDSFRDTIKDLLEDFGYKIISAENGNAGIKIAKLTKPDLILCSIELPDLDGLAVLSEISKQQDISTIPFFLCTSEKTEMTDLRSAMELGADDYFIKPIKAGQLIRSIEARLKRFDKIAGKQDNQVKKNNNGNNNGKKLSTDDRLFLMVGNRPEILKICNIVYISAAEEYSNVYTVETKHLLVQKLLKEWEKILPAKVFVRIHRSTIINLDFVKKVEKWFNHSFRIYLEDVSEPFIISRRYSTRLRSLLNTTKW